MAEKVITNFEKDIYKKYYPLVFSNCKKRLYDSNAIEDAVQSTFLMYIREQESISSSLSSWLYWSSTSVCKVINKETKQNKNLSEQQNLQSSKNAKVQPLQEEETIEQLKTILDKLPKKKQEMLIMRFFDGMTYSQIALHFKSSEDGVRKMIEHTLNSLKEKLNKNDIVFSTLFAQFFQSQPMSDATIASVAAKSQTFILQNTIKQQLIVKGVHKMILFSKLKMALILCVGISLPVSAILVAENKTNMVVVNVAKNSDPEVKNPAPITNENQEPVKTEKTLVGTWILKTKTKEWPYPIGSTLTIKNDGNFEIANNNKNSTDANGQGNNREAKPITGKYTTKDSTIVFDFGPNAQKQDCTFTFGTDNNLTFKQIREVYVMTMDYVKSDQK